MSPPPTRRRKWLRRVAWFFGVVIVLLMLVVAGVAFVLHDLQRTIVKSRIQRLVYHMTGIELDFETARASLSGLHLTGLTVQTPRSLRALAPLVARVGSVDVGWSVKKLMAASVSDVVLRDVDLTVVLDTDGSTSFDFLPPSAPGTTLPQKVAETVPRSKLVGDLIATPLPLGGLTIEPIHVVVIRADHRKVVETDTLDGLKLGASRENGRTTLGLGTKAQPLDLHLVRDGAQPGTATVRIWLDGVAQETSVQISVETRVLEQSIAPDLAPLVKPTRLASLVFAVDAEPKNHRIITKVTHCELADGIAALAFELELADDASRAPILHSGDGKIDAKRALEFVPPRFAPSLPRVTAGSIEFHGKQVALTTIPRVLAGGSLDAKIALDGVRVGQPDLAVVARRVRLDVSTGADLHLDVKAAVDVETLRWEGAGLRVALVDTKLALDAKALEVTSDVPTYAGTLGVEGKRVQVARTGRTLVDDSMHATLHLEDVKVVKPALQSTANARLDATMGGTVVKLDAKKTSDALDYTLDVTSPSIGLVGALAGKLAVQVPWSRIGLQLSSKGEVRGLAGSPTLRHDTKLELAHPSMSSAQSGAVSATSISVLLASHGDAKVHEGDLTLGIVALQHGKHTLGDGTLVTHVRADLGAPSISATIASHGTASPGIDGKLDFSFDKRTSQTRFDVALALGKLDTLGPLLPALKGFDLEGVEAELHGKGALTGVLRWKRGGGLGLAADPLHHVHGDADLGFSVKRFGWHDASRWVTTPAVAWKCTLRAAGELRTLKGELDIDQVHFAIGPARFDAKGLSDLLVLKLEGDPDTAVLDVDERMHMSAFHQELAPDYATGDVSLVMHASVDHAGVIRLPEVTLMNAAAGTRFTLAGGVDLGEDRRSLSLHGTLDQDLAKLWGDPKVFMGRGHLTTDVHVESGDMRRFHTVTSLKLRDGDLELPKQKVKAIGLDCEIPIVEDVQLGVGGAKLIHDIEVNNYSELRFADQHPLITRRSFLAAKRIETPWIDIAPLAGNLVIDNRTASISQIDLGVRSGRVTGRGTVVLAGQDTKAELNLRVTGVRSTHNEPFDGNAALAISARQRSIDGRIEVLRMGRRHLLDVLDLVDPPRTDAAINRVRKVLVFGYPDHVRVSLNRGFASAKIEFGGIARMFKLDEIKGIPMGPIVDRVLAPLFDANEEN
ncbi:MAG: hypothetical protein ABI321_19565 [Polyangia bacterium]